MCFVDLNFICLLFHPHQSSLDLTLAFITGKKKGSFSFIKDEGTHSRWRVRYSLETIDSKLPKAAR